MNTLLTLEMVSLVNGLAIQHSSEWEDYLEMNAQINGMTKEEYAAYYLGTQWQMQCMESLQRLTEKKVTRKQLDKAINDVAAITDKLKKVVKEWAAARDAGKTEKQEEKLQELKKLNDDKTAAQKVVDDHIQQLDKNATLQTTESVNEKNSIKEAKFVKDFNREVLKAKTKEEVSKLYPSAEFYIGKSDHFFGELQDNLFFKAYYTKGQDEFEITSVYSQKGKNYVNLYLNESIDEKKSEFKEGDKVKLTLKGLQQMNRHRTPGISNDYSRSLGKIRDKDIAGTVERVFPSGGMNVRFDGVLYDIKDYMVVKESVNEKYRETRHQSTDFSKPGNDGDIYFSKREGSAVGVKQGDKLQMIYVFQKEPKLGKIQKSDKRWENMGPASEKLLIDLRGREEGKILFKFVSTLESMNEKIEVASLADAIDAEQDGNLNKRHLDKILKRKATKTMHQLTRAEEKTYHAILRKYKIAPDNAHAEDMMEAIDIDMINTEYGFWGTMDQYEDFDSIEIAFEDAMNYLIGSYNFTQDSAYNFLNSKWGRKLADEYYDGEHYSMVDAIEAFGNKSTWKKYAKMFSESKENTMKNLQTLESFINEAAPKLKTSKEEAGLLKLRDEIRRARKGGSVSRYTKEFDSAKKRALKAIEDMITYAKIGV